MTLQQTSFGIPLYWPGFFVEVCSGARYEAQLADDTSLYN